MIVFCRDTQTSSRVTPAGKEGRRSGRQKASVNQRVYDLVNFILIMNTYGHFKEMEQFVGEINGVEIVKSDSNSNKLEVKGKVDPIEIKRMIKRKTKRKVKLIFPSAESVVHGDENKRPDEKLGEKTRQDDIANAKSEEGLTVLKIKLCCNSCNQKLKNDLKDRGLETVEMDMDMDLVTVKGTVNMTEIKSYMREVRKKDVEVVVPAKKDAVATDKKNRETGATKKKDKDVGPTDKKGKEVGATDTTIRDKESVLTDKKSGKNGGATVNKGKEVDAADKHSQRKGHAGVPKKSENKDSGVKQKKDRHSGHRKNEETSRDGSRRRNNQEVVIGVPINVNTPYYQGSVDDVYDYSSCDRCHHRRPVNYSNVYDIMMFSDENPHSCTIM